MNLDEFLRKFERVKKRAGNQYEALCSGHEDRTQSLGITEKDGKILLRCRAGCETKDILAAVGVDYSDLFAEGKNGNGSHPVPVSSFTSYRYEDEQGRLLFEKLRKPGKQFTQRAADGATSLETVRRVPYRLPDLLARKDDFIFFVEGEKDVDNLFSVELLATTNPEGAGKWRDEYTEFFRGRRVFILPDNDDPGRAHAALVHSKLLPVAERVRIINLPGLPPKGDISDWLDRGGTREELLALCRPTAALGVRVCDAITDLTISRSKAFVSTGIEALDQQLGGGLFPELTLIQGSTGAGKTTLALQLAFSAIRGSQRPVVYLTTEMRPDELQARRVCQILGATQKVHWRDALTGKITKEISHELTRLENVYVLPVGPSMSLGEEVFSAVEAHIEVFGEAPIVVCDYLQGLTLSAMMDRRVVMGSIVYELQKLTAKYGTPVLCLSSVSRQTYTTEKRDSENPLDFLGSAKESGEIEYAAAVVLHLDVQLEPDEEGWRPARLVVCKSRFGQPGIIGLRFHGQSGRFQPDPLSGLTKQDLVVIQTINQSIHHSANEICETIGKRKGDVLCSIRKLTNLNVIENTPSGYKVKKT